MGCQSSRRKVPGDPDEPDHHRRMAIDSQKPFTRPGNFLDRIDRKAGIREIGNDGPADRVDRQKDDHTRKGSGEPVKTHLKFVLLVQDSLPARVADTQ